MLKVVSVILCIHHLPVWDLVTNANTRWSYIVMSVTLSCLCSCLNFFGHGEDKCCHSLDCCLSFTSYVHAHVLSEPIILSKNVSSSFGYCRRWVWAVSKCLHICILEKVYGTYCAAVFLIVRALVPMSVTSSWQDRHPFSASSSCRQAIDLLLIQDLSFGLSLPFFGGLCEICCKTVWQCIISTFLIKRSMALTCGFTPHHMNIGKGLLFLFGRLCLEYSVVALLRYFTLAVCHDQSGI